MRTGVHPIDRADHHARPDQHRRRSDLGMLPRLSRLVRRKCCVRLSVCCYPDNPGRHQAFAWLLFAVVMVTVRAGDGSGLGRTYLFGALGYCLFAIAKDAWVLFLNPTRGASTRPNYYSVSASGLGGS